MHGAWVRSLVGELRSCMLWGMAKQEKKRNSRGARAFSSCPTSRALLFHAHVRTGEQVIICKPVREFSPDPDPACTLVLVCVCVCVCVCACACLVTFNSLRPHGLWLTKLLCPRDSPGMNTGVGSRSLFQGIFPTQGLNRGLLHCRQILYQLSHQGSLYPNLGLASRTCENKHLWFKCLQSVVFW